MGEKNEFYEVHTDLPLKENRTAAGETVDENEQLRRGLKSRHVQLIALGGCIGTGLFVGSGAILSNSGPASLLLAYIIMSSIIWTVMNALGEMTTYLPLHGVSPPLFVYKYADTSLAFATGWNYWYAYAFLVPSEVTASAIIVEYWTDKVPTAAWIAIFLIMIVLVNVFMVDAFGEVEFWMASIKVVTMLGLIIVGVVIFFGGTPRHDRLGFRYWKNDAFKEYIVPDDSGRLCGFWNALVRSGFSFIMSPELITVCAGETEAPRRNIPKATRRFIYRLLFFYIVGSLVIGVIVASDDQGLLNAVSQGKEDGAASPFVIGVKNAQIQILPHIINAAILTSAISAGNSFLFAGSRTLYSLACEGHAPKIFRRCNRWGVPYTAVAGTAVVACLAFLNASSSSADVFTWFTNISTISGFIAWIAVLTAYLRFRAAMKYNNIYDTLPFKAPFQPYFAIYTLFVVSVITLTNGFTVFVGLSDSNPFSPADFVAAYITLPLFVVIYFGHKIWTRNWQWLYPIHEIDVLTGLDEAEKIERSFPERKPANIFQRIWFWIA